MKLPSGEHIWIPMLDSIDHPVDELQFAVDNMTRDALHAQSAVSNLRGIYHDISRMIV